MDERANESIEELDRLLADPTRWAEVDPEKLRHLLFYQCLSYGLEPDEARIPGLMDLHRVALARLDPAVRRQVVVHLARAIERVHREQDIREGAGCTNALLPFLLEDPDPAVVAAAAGEMALLLPREEGEELSGPRYVRSLLDEVRGDDARAGIVAGLLQLGDPRLEPLVSGSWGTLGEEGRQTLALLIQAFRGVHTLTVEFLVSWLEDESKNPAGATFGVVAATLARAGRYAGEHGVTHVRRSFPVTELPESEASDASRSLPIGEVAAPLLPRLAAAARREAPPRLMPHVLSYWGFDVEAYRLAAEAALAAARATRDAATGLCEPERLDLVPDWPEEPELETQIEWGIFNPLGPSTNTLRLTPLDSSWALVYTLYHPAGSASRIMAAWDARPDAPSLASAVGRVLSGNGRAGVWLVRSLPDYVYLPAGSALTAGDVAAGLAAARRAALVAGEPPANLRAHAERLRRLASDPWAVAGEEIQRAESATAAHRDSCRTGVPPVGADDTRRTGVPPVGADAESAAAAGAAAGERPADFLAWLDVAAAPAHVAAIRGQVPVAWQRLVATPGDDEGTADG